MKEYSDPPSLQASRTSTCVSSQQSTLVGILPQPGGAAFRSAIFKFRARLSGTHLTEFQTTTYEDLCRDLMRVQLEQQAEKSMMNMSRIQSCLEAMHHFGKTIEVFLNVHNAVAFVWGPLKFLLLTASTFVDSFEALLDAYEQIGEHMPMLQEYEQLFHENPHLVEALELMYIDILEFHHQAMQFFSGKRWRRIFRSMWKDFETKFGGVLKSLQRHKDLIEQRASLAQYRKYREDMDLLKAKLMKDVGEEQDKKMRTVREWLSAGDQQEVDHNNFCGIRKEFPTTGSWILKDDSIRDWLDADVPISPITWINGISGAGKTILASAIIDECKKMHPLATSYFYCHYDDRNANSTVAILRGLVDQLLTQHPHLLPPCHQKRSGSGEPSLRSVPVAKRLFEDFWSTIPKMLVVIDGLDECEANERKQILECIVEAVGRCNDEEPGRFRVLFVSQDFADIRRALHNPSSIKTATKIIPLSARDNASDIATYVNVRTDMIAQKFAPFDERMVSDLRELTVARARGMFLYAKLVMLNLYDQPTRGDLLDAITEQNFPDGLEQAYKRIVERIKRSNSKKIWDQAKTLLGWMVCCKRQLTWKEIQVALSIDVDEQRIDYDNMSARTHIYDICGSLIQKSGDRVQLVHSTAKQYITKCTKDIHPPSVECELAAKCLQYLTFPCFDPEEDNKDLLRNMMFEGHFAFQDYAVATWSLHLNAFVETGKNLSEIDETLLEDIRIAIDFFMQRYDEENWHTNIVPECRERCKVFEDQDFYEDLVALTSHIYTFHSKGFELKHKISIKSLEAALERNRKLLEEPTSKMRRDEQEAYRRYYDEERRFKCNRITCMYFSEGFSDAKLRKRHVNIHARPFQCEISGCLGHEGFANNKDLEKHKRAFHPDSCDLAERFNTVANKKAKTDHTCTICGKSFTRKQIMKDHENSHKGIRGHECSECGKAFTRKNDLTRHQKIHSRR